MLNRIKDSLKLVNKKTDRSELGTLYSLLYDIVHDMDGPPEMFVKQTQNTFEFQWDKLNEGEAMLSDPWFKNQLPNLISDHELLIDRDWFKGRNVLDLGCGGGRWSYGLAALGANVTAVDINESALNSTRIAHSEFDNVKIQYVKSSLEDLSSALDPAEKFDLVWSWGVIHHCNNFNMAFNNAMSYVNDGGLIYLYLCGRESVPYAGDINKFKKRLHYNSLKTWDEKRKYLLDYAKGDASKIHQLHDMLAPLINRRLEYEHVKKRLEERGFQDVFRTVDHTELFIRGIKGKNPKLLNYIHYKMNEDHWIKRYAN